MSDINNNSNDKNTFLPPGSVNSVKHGFSSNSEKDVLEASPFTNFPSSKEVTRQSLYDMNAVAGRSLVKKTPPKSPFQTTFQGNTYGNQILEDKSTGIKITPESIVSVSESLQSLLNNKNNSVERALAVGDLAFGKAVKDKAENPYARALTVEAAAEREFASL